MHLYIETGPIIRWASKYRNKIFIILATLRHRGIIGTQTSFKMYVEMSQHPIERGDSTNNVLGPDSI